jgi:hypothetical protein
MSITRGILVVIASCVVLLGLILAACAFLAPEVPEPEPTITTIQDPVGDTYTWYGYMLEGPAWVDITQIQIVDTEETVEMTIACYDPLPNIAECSVTYVLVDVNQDAQVYPANDIIDFYGGNFDYGIFTPSPEFGEPPIFIEDLRAQGEAPYITEGVEYSIEENEIRIRAQWRYLGEPEGPVGFVFVHAYSITEPDRVEDRAPNEGLTYIRSESP